MKNKIGIITFHRAMNYGAVFQTYALQQCLNDNEIENEVIDYVCQNIEECYKPFKVMQGNYFKAIVRGVLFSGIIRRKKRQFEFFLQKYLVMSKKYYSLDELRNARDEYSCFISGSDQVWSPNSAGFDEAYFLTFAHDRQKNSYAASIGMNSLPLQLVEEYKNRLQEFQNISVREQEAKSLLLQYINKDIEVHVDPTLLLSSEQWRLISKEPKEKGYIVIFNVEKPIYDIQFAKKVAKERNLKIIYINDRTVKKEKGIKYVVAPTPEEFLGYFANADVVVTNSFHGTAFSIIFHKNLYVELNNRKRRNVRAEDLLNLVGIKGRIIEEGLNEDSVELLNWKAVDEIISAKKQEAVNYLTNINI